MEKMYYCPACSNPLLRITTIEEGEDVDHYICDICDISYTEDDLNPLKKTQKKK
jgi:transposase-like protein